MPIEIDNQSTSTERNKIDVDGWRQTKRNNKSWLTWKMPFEVIDRNERFIPRILVNAGFFESTSQVKKNQPDLWRKISDDTILEQVELSWATIEIWTEDI